MAKYDVISPDGFSIERDRIYDTKEEARQAFVNWRKRYEKQGYYSSNNGRIPLNLLEDYCSFVIVKENTNLKN